MLLIQLLQSSHAGFSRLATTTSLGVFWLTQRQGRKQHAAKGGAIYRYGDCNTLKILIYLVRPQIPANRPMCGRPLIVRYRGRGRARAGGQPTDLARICPAPGPFHGATTAATRTAC